VEILYCLAELFEYNSGLIFVELSADHFKKAAPFHVIKYQVDLGSLLCIA